MYLKFLNSCRFSTPIAAGISGTVTAGSRRRKSGGIPEDMDQGRHYRSEGSIGNGHRKSLLAFQDTHRITANGLKDET
jgi:hypothetical protein